MISGVSAFARLAQYQWKALLYQYWNKINTHISKLYCISCQQVSIIVNIIIINDNLYSAAYTSRALKVKHRKEDASNRLKCRNQFVVFLHQFVVYVTLCKRYVNALVRNLLTVIYYFSKFGSTNVWSNISTIYGQYFAVKSVISEWYRKLVCWPLEVRLTPPSERPSAVRSLAANITALISKEGNLICSACGRPCVLRPPHIVSPIESRSLALIVAQVSITE